MRPCPRGVEHATDHLPLAGTTHQDPSTRVSGVGEGGGEGVHIETRIATEGGDLVGPNS